MAHCCLYTLTSLISYNRVMTDTKQTDSKGRFIKGNTVAKDAGVDFGSMPENRHSGAWKKEDTPRFKLEQMMKLSEPDLRKVAEDKDAPLFERKLATAIAKGQWREIKEMIQEVYGKPKESVDVTSGGEPIKALVEFKGADN